MFRGRSYIQRMVRLNLVIYGANERATTPFIVTWSPETDARSPPPPLFSVDRGRLSNQMKLMWYIARTGTEAGSRAAPAGTDMTCKTHWHHLVDVSDGIYM